MPKILVVNGPNLNLLGTREPQLYGADTLADVDAVLLAQAKILGVGLVCFQSNHEGAIVDRIQAARDEGVAWILINPGAYAHTSVAIRDALAAVRIPFVELHISNVYRREPFRHHSYLSDLAEAVMAGFGVHGYGLALEFISGRLENKRISY